MPLEGRNSNVLAALLDDFEQGLGPRPARLLADNMELGTGLECPAAPRIVVRRKLVLHRQQDVTRPDSNVPCRAGNAVAAGWDNGDVVRRASDHARERRAERLDVFEEVAWRNRPGSRAPFRAAFRRLDDSPRLWSHVCVIQVTDVSRYIEFRSVVVGHCGNRPDHWHLGDKGCHIAVGLSLNSYRVGRHAQFWNEETDRRLRAHMPGLCPAF